MGIPLKCKVYIYWDESEVKRNYHMAQSRESAFRNIQDKPTYIMHFPIWLDYNYKETCIYLQFKAVVFEEITFQLRDAGWYSSLGQAASFHD